MLIEELLEFLVTEVDTNLLKAVVVKDLKASNIQAADVLNFLHRWIKEPKNEKWITMGTFGGYLLQKIIR